MENFALLHRPGSHPGQVELLRCEIGAPAAGERLMIVPAGAEPPVTLGVTGRVSMPVEVALRRFSAELPALATAGFDISDDDYAAIVRRVVDEDIATGAGSNFVIRRTFLAAYEKWHARAATALFANLLRAEHGAYWTFVVHWAGRTLAGATPECHVRMSGGRAAMNPISGTYRYPPQGPDAAGLQRFLTDRKERAELLMVVDEELKMMARVCPGGGRVRGPWLRPMARLAHTEYVIEGPTPLDPAEVLRRTMPVPTVTGSPVAGAQRVVAAHERTDRGCYGGVLALVDGREMDSALLIRTADIDARGRVAVAVGATLVRGSDPRAEVRETQAKAAAVLGALHGGGPAPVPSLVRVGLPGRNTGLSRFWLGGHKPVAPPTGERLVIVDAADDFTAMLARMAESLGLAVEVVPWHRYRPADAAPRPGGPGKAALTLLGPGPGDPRDRTDPRIARLRDIAGELLVTGAPLLAVCLGHQCVAAELGLRLVRLDRPAQGVRRLITVAGRPEQVGFYNSFAAVSATDRDGPYHFERDETSTQVHTIGGPGLRTVQFHVESLLTEHGPELLRSMIAAVRQPARSDVKVHPTVRW
ncbi:anthranilate synthase family protein [Actinoplanes sp. N902-109]|uniref:anthranilate synthase family protein n=1 Tax=Actinoplanes sp. (strain N902-109) TaxID=649831 RepID=UPI00032939C3|nr:anthranilate synthase family protein [Actinoplanes sp. N902-109]AGL18889.1 putative anthranilate synthase [Actinoplanes sp. N902-109]